MESRHLATHPMVKNVLFTQNQINERIAELAKSIDEAYKDKKEPLVLVGVLKGAVMFLTDLSRHITIPHTLEFLAVSSYGHTTTSSGTVRMIMDTREDVAGKNVLLVEDIVDTGFTMSYLLQLFKTRNVASVECAVFLQKTKCLKVEGLHAQLKWVAFEIEPVFVIGYGLDFAENYRSLPFVGELKEEAYKK